jgi:hypothetical protein
MSAPKVNLERFPQISDKGWHHAFDDAIPLPGGGELHTLRDAGDFIAKLPKREHDAPAWLAAIPALMLGQCKPVWSRMARAGKRGILRCVPPSSDEQPNA